MTTPFQIRVDDAELDDLRERLRRTRWPEPATAPGWTQGVPLDYAREVCTYWADGYD
jgi:epoxide hydrolase